MDGGSVTGLMEAGARLPEAVVPCVVRAALDVVAVMHGGGRMHRDVKWDSLLLSRDGRIAPPDCAFFAHVRGGAVPYEHHRYAVLCVSRGAGGGRPRRMLPGERETGERGERVWPPPPAARRVAGGGGGGAPSGPTRSSPAPMCTAPHGSRSRHWSRLSPPRPPPLHPCPPLHPPPPHAGMAVELIRGGGYGPRADSWSLGMVALELAEHAAPHLGQPPLGALELIATRPPPRLRSPTSSSPASTSAPAAAAG